MTPEQKVVEFLEAQAHMIVAVTREDGRLWPCQMFAMRREV